MPRFGCGSPAFYHYFTGARTTTFKVNVFHLFVVFLDGAQGSVEDPGLPPQVARTAALRPIAFWRRADFAVRVFSVAIIGTVPYSIAVSKLRRPFLSDRYFFIVVRLLRRRGNSPSLISPCSRERVATVSVFLTVGFSHARYPNGNRT